MWDTLLVFFIVILILWYWKTCQHSGRFPPGPRCPLPVLGDAYILGNDLEKGFEKLILKYGKIFGLWLGPLRAVVVADFDILQEVLNKPETTDRPQGEGDIVRNSLSQGSVPGILMSSGKTWAGMRKTSVHTLRNFGVGKTILEDIIEENVDNLLEHIDNNYLNQPIDVLRLFNVSMVASLWRIVSGEHLKLGDAKLEKLVCMVQNLTKEFGSPLTCVSMNYPWLHKILNNVGMIHVQSYVRNLLKFCASVLTDHKDKHIDGENPMTFTEAILYKIQETSDPNDPLFADTGELNLINALFDFFMAGSDSTAITLDWGMLFMIQNPDVQTKVRQELDQNIGLKKAKTNDKYKIPYTEAVIHEILRKANVFPLSVFHNTRANIDIGKYSLPSETTIIPFIGDIMNDPEYFPEPSKFKPERYLVAENGSEDVKFQAHPRVIPFGVGKRRCIGETLAKLSLYKFFTALIQKYEIVSGQSEPIYDTRDLGFIKGPLRYKLMFKQRL